MEVALHERSGRGSQLHGRRLRLRHSGCPASTQRCGASSAHTHLGLRPAQSRLAVPTWRTSAWRSADPRRSDAVLAYVGPATSRPTSTTGEHQELLTGSSALDGAVPNQKVKRVGHGFRNFANYRLRLLLHCGVTWQTHRTARLRGRSPSLVALEPQTVAVGCDRMPRGAHGKGGDRQFESARGLHKYFQRYETSRSARLAETPACSWYGAVLWSLQAPNDSLARDTARNRRSHSPRLRATGCTARRSRPLRCRTAWECSSRASRHRR